MLACTVVQVPPARPLEDGDAVMNEADFAALNEHLQEVKPVFDDFCARNGFAYADRKALGRYPRIRVERVGATTLWFDLWMELDKEGRRVEKFRRDLPYELSAGAYVDVPDGSKHGTRFGKRLRCFSGKPFDQVGAVLRDEMQEHLPILAAWDAQYLKGNGERLPLRA